MALVFSAIAVDMVPPLVQKTLIDEIIGSKNLGKLAILVGMLAGLTTTLANAAGLVPDVRGMHEPSVNLDEIPQRFSLQSMGGLLSQHGVVELANSVAWPVGSVNSS